MKHLNRKMNKFNRKFNKSYARFRFWHTLTKHCADLLQQIQKQSKDCLTPDDGKILFGIHVLLFECYKRANVQKNFHSEELTKVKRCVKNDK